MVTLQKHRVRNNKVQGNTARNSTTHNNTVQMNTRIDANLKQRYERVLARHGWTHSQLVRELCEYVADEGKLPDMTTQEARQSEDEEVRKRLEALEKLENLIPDALESLGLPRDTPSPLDGLSAEETKELLHEWRYEDYMRKQMEDYS